MRLLRWFNNFDKEERWLNKMAAQGYHLSHKTSFGTYVFDEGHPYEQNYRIDFRQFSNMGDYQDYINLFADSGWRLIYGDRREGTQYFVPYPDADTEDIFSDALSKAGRYNRISQQYIVFAVPFLALFVIFYTSGYYTDLGFEYLTPGLWEKTGFSFVRAFLFETPFVIMRGSLYLLPVICVGVYLYFAVKAKLKYREAVRQSPL